MRKSLYLLLALCAVTAGCGKKVDLGDLGSSSLENPPRSLAFCGADRTRGWHFTQPNATVSRSVDLLFVVDTSGSMATKNARLASTIPAFAGVLSPDVDYRVGVMLAHGGASQYSGKLYSQFGSPKVLNSKTQTTADIERLLQDTLDSPSADADQAQGEAMFYSFGRSLDGSLATQIQSQGFYRPEAALSVVFVSDENDICYPPELHGFTTFPDFAPSYQNAERVAYDKYCKDITPESVLAKARHFKGTKPVLFGAITHVDPAAVPHKAATDEFAIGHGQLELVQQTLDGVRIDIEKNSFSDGLAKLGDVTMSSLNLQTAFVLNNSSGVHENQLAVWVDDKKVAATFDSATSTVRIPAADAGHAGSSVDVSACF